MTALSNGIVPLEFTKSCEMKMAAVQNCKLTRKIVFIAKHVISKIQAKILDGLPRKGAAVQIIPICK